MIDSDTHRRYSAADMTAALLPSLPDGGNDVECGISLKWLNWRNASEAGLKVRGLGGAQPPALSTAPQRKREWGGRLMEGIRERGKR